MALRRERNGYTTWIFNDKESLDAHSAANYMLYPAGGTVGSAVKTKAMREHGHFTDTLPFSKKKGFRLERRKPLISILLRWLRGPDTYRIDNS
jgi:hypothetical protein